MLKWVTVKKVEKGSGGAPEAEFKGPPSAQAGR